MTEPIIVCELDAGRPSHHVPRFHMMAAIKSAKTIAKPAEEPTCKINSTGRSETMPKATRPEDQSTPERLQSPTKHGDLRRQRVCVDDGRDRIGRVVEAVDELEAERNDQRQAEQQVGEHRSP